MSLSRRLTRFAILTIGVLAEESLHVAARNAVLSHHNNDYYTSSNNRLRLKNQHLRTSPLKIVRKDNCSASPWVSVLDFGAIADNATDCTTAFQKALDNAASSGGGGVVYAPPGLYLFQSSIRVPPGVTLQGSFQFVPSHSMHHNPINSDGTILIPTGGRGNTDPELYFIHVGANAAVTGLVIYHKEQEHDKNSPVPYPWSIQMMGNNAAVTDVELLNSWNGINATKAHRHYIARIQGQPLNIGIYVDATYDIGRIEDVHFNPWYSNARPFFEYQLLHGRAFVFGRSDWEYVFNTFAFGYNIGYHFIQTSTGNMNGNFLGIGADCAVNASVLVDASQAPGILITNGEFTAMANWLPPDIANQQDSSQVKISPTNHGPVKFVNSAFWGKSSSIAKVQGSGVITFSDCQFVQWDLQQQQQQTNRYSDYRESKSVAALDILSGRVIITSNVFHKNHLSISMDETNVQQAIVQGNMFAGDETTVLNVTVPSHKTKQIIVMGNSFAAAMSHDEQLMTHG